MGRILAVAVLLGVAISAPGSALAMGAGCTGRWAVFANPAAPRGSLLYDVAAVSATDVWAVGYGWIGATRRPMAEHWGGSRWSVMMLPAPSDGDAYLFGVAGVAADDVWAVGSAALPFAQTLIEHWDGSTWSIVPSPNPSPFRNQLFGVSAVAADDVWAVGDAANEGGDVSLILYWDGQTWASVLPPSLGKGIDHLEGVAGVAADDVWAVGQWTNGLDGVTQALTEHWDGSSWTKVDPAPHQPAPNVLYGVARTSPTGVAAVGDRTPGWGSETLIIRWNGAGWSREPSDHIRGTLNILNDVSADSDGDAWAVGYYMDVWQRTEIQQWDGTSWHHVPSPNDGAINWLEGVVTVSAQEAWAVGQGEEAALIEHYCTGRNRVNWPSVLVRMTGTEAPCVLVP